MKNSNEMFFSLMERKAEYETNQKNRRRAFRCALIPICCLCLMSVIGIGAWHMNMPDSEIPKTVDDALLPGTKDWYGPGEEESHIDESDNYDESVTDDFFHMIFSAKVNRIGSAVNGAKLYYDPEIYDDLHLNEREAAEYLGIDITELNFMGAGYNKKNESQFTLGLVTDKNGIAVYDTGMFSFGSNDRFTVLVSKIGVPYDCLYLYDTAEMSTVRCADGIDRKVLIGTYGTEYIADFEINGFKYRIRMKCAGEDDLETFVFAIISLMDLSIAGK